MPKEKIHFIYKIYFLCGEPEGRYYIGKHTGYKNDSYGGSGTFCKRYYKKYGKIPDKTFKREIIEINVDKETNRLREKEIVGELWKTDPLCMNILPGGVCDPNCGNKPGMKGKHHSEESKRKISESNKGRKWTEEQYKAAKNRKISEETRYKQSESHKGNHNALGHTLSDEVKQILSEKLTNNSKLKVKRYEPSDETREKFRQNAIGNKYAVGHAVPEELKKLNSELFSKQVNQYDLTGTLIKEWHSVKDATESFESDARSSITNCCNRKKNYKTAFGFIWRWPEDTVTENDLKALSANFTKVAQLDLNGNIIKVFEKIKDAEVELGINHSSICMCCKGKRNVAGGFKWKYIQED